MYANNHLEELRNHINSNNYINSALLKVDLALAEAKYRIQLVLQNRKDGEATLDDYRRLFRNAETITLDRWHRQTEVYCQSNKINDVETNVPQPKIIIETMPPGEKGISNSTSIDIENGSRVTEVRFGYPRGFEDKRAGCAIITFGGVTRDTPAELLYKDVYLSP